MKIVKKMIGVACCPIAIAMLSVAGVSAEDYIEINYDVTVVSELLDKGSLYYGDEPALLTAATVAFGDSRYAFDVGHRRALASSYDDLERLDYALSFGGSVEGGPFSADMVLAGVYHHNYNVSGIDSLELVLTANLNGLLPDGIVPSYTVAFEEPIHGGPDMFFHEFGLNWSVPTGFSGSAYRFANLSASVAYRDEVVVDLDSGFTHATFGVEIPITLSEGVTVVPMLFYQLSMEDSVMREDHLYSGLSFRF